MRVTARVSAVAVALLFLVALLVMPARESQQIAECLEATAIFPHRLKALSRRSLHGL